MCGIIGICAIKRNVAPMISLGLKRLEYRGYDSVGVALVLNESRVHILKARGDVDSFLSRFKVSEFKAYTGLGHTRWATHGAPSDVNAHPHTDCSGRIAVVHNGVIRNFSTIKSILEVRGHRITSETDTELIAHLIEDEIPFSSNFFEAFIRAISRLEGSYALAIINSSEPNKVYFARLKSPLVLGLGDGFNIIASDIPAVIEYTRRVLTLEDGEVGWITPTKVKLFKLTDDGIAEVKYESIMSRVRFIEWSFEEATRLGYPHFMLKEIVEQPNAIKSTYDGNIDDPIVKLAASLLNEANHIVLVGAGTSYHASLIISYFLSKIAKIKSTPLIASEYKVVEDSISREDVILAVSQSGETYDTLEAIRAFKRRGAKVIGITNVVGSALSRESDIAIYMRCGPEIGVAATKTYTSQIMVGSILAIYSAIENKSLDNSSTRNLIDDLSKASDILGLSIKTSLSILNDSPLRGIKSMYILGRGLGSMIAKEASLKVKEIAYIHAESYPAGESKHGPIALVEEKFPVYFIATSDSLEIIGNIMEMASRGASIVVVKPENVNLNISSSHSINVVDMPPVNSLLLEPYTLIPYFQLLAYKEAVARGYNPDKPRNLAKTVTVE
ncbi:MAG: glutamine--fructose-6-phosphate transaminase (isomerizing) [Acidilobaceae archaeon]